MALQRWTRLLQRGGGVGALRRLSSQTPVVSVEDEQVQELLRRVTGVDLDRVFSTRKEALAPPHYRLMTRDQLQEVHDDIMSEAQQLVKMTPVLAERAERGQTISRDEEVEGYLDHPTVFTDISQGVEAKDRRVVVRESSGVLREAGWEERDRMMEVYFPSLGRKMWLPAMLTAQGLLPVLEEGRYWEVLDVACVQCEPDSADYIRVRHTVYESIEQHRSYDSLRSTKHFGGLVWYLVQKERVTGLLSDMVQRKLWSDGEDLVKLYLLCHPQSSLATSTECRSGEQLVAAFCRHFSLGELSSQLPPLTEPADHALNS